ncbi:MAG: intradiol ring-cleavage dioxygenase [Polyangiales bacterium]
METKITRRRALLGLGASFAAFSLLACGDDDDGATEEGPYGGDGGHTDPAADASTGMDAARDAATEASTATDASVLTGWATGGVAAMTAKASYPNPFTSAGTSCELTCEATIGPCHTTSPLRVDVSNGWDGLPMRIAVRVVDASCTPVVGALVEIWHTNYKGIYSGRISTMCNKDEVDRADDYFRGYQVSDADGVVYFDSVFPGWYSGRAVHIHLRVLKGSYQSADNAEAWNITQLLWDDQLVKSIFADQPLYKDYGTPDTLLSADNVVGGESDKTRITWDIAKMTDGAMLASKTLVLRSSLSEPACSLSGSGGGGGGPGGGGPGGPP